jgi:hypothetical protein
MSRPIASVPSGKVHDPPACQKGGFRKAVLLVRIGECGAITFASSATRTSATITISPATAPAFALK